MPSNFRGDFWPRRCYRSEPRQEPTRTQTPLGPSPFRGDLTQNGAHPWAYPAVDQNQDLVFGALTEVTAGGLSAPISWWDGANRQVAPRRPHGGGRILSTCTFLRLRGRAPTSTRGTGFVSSLSATIEVRVLDRTWT